jgi:hypothetical protein
MYLAKMDDDELNYPSDRFHELNKDAMMEKLVLMWTWYFWVATELRFLVEEKVDEFKEFRREHAEMWHAQGAFIGSLFLPKECPLVNHLIISYDKYFIKTRDEEEKELNETSVTSKLKKAKLMFKSRKNSAKPDSRNAEVLKKSKSFKLIVFPSESSSITLPKNFQLHLSNSKPNFQT